MSDVFASPPLSIISTPLGLPHNSLGQTFVLVVHQTFEIFDPSKNHSTGNKAPSATIEDIPHSSANMVKAGT